MSDHKPPKFDWNSLKDILPDRTTKPPENSFNVFEYAEQHKTSRKAARHLLNHATSTGKLEAKTYYVAEYKRHVRYYWIPKKKK